MKRSPSIGNLNINSFYNVLENENINNLKMLTRELEPEELRYIRQRHNERKKLTKEANLLKNLVKEMKEDIQNNYDSNNNLPWVKINKINSKRASESSIININSNHHEFKRKSFDIFINKRHSFNKNKEDIRKKYMKKKTARNLKTNILDLNYDDIQKTKSKISDDSNIENDTSNNNLKKTDMKIEVHPPENNQENNNYINNNNIFINKSLIGNKNNERKNSIDLSMLNHNKLSLNNNLKLIGYEKTKTFLTENVNFLHSNDEDGNSSLIHNSRISSNNILKLKELKNEIKNSFIGEQIKSTKIKETKNYLIDDIIENNSIQNLETQNKEEENYDIDYIEQRYRVLQKKGYVYDSLDDEENIDEEKLSFFIRPESRFILFFDFLINLCSLYYLIYIPYYLGSKEFYCRKGYFFNKENSFELFVDFIYFIDLILPFFIAFYNFEEILKTNIKDISKNYLSGWFLLDFIQAIPFKTIFVLFDTKCQNKDFLNNPLYHKNFQYLLLCFRMLKIFKVLSKNKFLELLSSALNEIEYFSNYLTIYECVIIFFIAIHIVSNIFIFIARNDYPNWITIFGYDNHPYIKLYLIGIYYTIATLTTVGYGDLFCISTSEKVFGMLMEVVGIFAYSWALTSVSNYVKILNEKTEEYEKNCRVLEEIKITYPQLSEDLYDRISRYLKYKQEKEQFDKNIVIECLPVNLSNILVYEMYKPIINNFIFFKNFENVDFIVKVILSFKPILAMKNDILIKDGDLVEDIVFVKKGKLSLELPLEKMSKANNLNKAQNNTNLTFNNTTIKNTTLKDSQTLFIKTPSINIENNNPFVNKRRSSIFESIQTFNQIQTTKKKKRKFFSRFRRKKKQKVIKNTNVQIFKILEIRKNEHFGDILMFLNQRSPLSLRVKTKKAELFFLNKTDAIDISTCYPTIWQKINMKSLFNFEQIKRLMNKIIKIFSHSNGLTNFNPLSKFSNKKNSINSTIVENPLIDEDSDLHSIPTFSDNLDYLEDGHIRLSKSIKKINSRKGNYNPMKEIGIIEEKSEDETYSNIDEKYGIISEKSKEDSDDEIDTINKHSYDDSSLHYTNRHKTKIENENNITPFKPEEINNEIYPDEIFINSPKKNYDIEIKESLNEEQLKTKLCTVIGNNINNIYNNNNINNNNNDNISICSTEISFTINSEYENIDELSSYKYSKDITLRNKIKRILQNDECDISDEYYPNLTKSISSDIEEEMNNFDNQKNITGKESFKFSKFKIKNTNSGKESLSLFNSINFSKRGFGLRKTGTTQVKHTNLQIINFQNKSQKNSNFIESRKTRKEIQHQTTKTKRNLLSTISKNIERNQINLNNPDLFYSEYFHKILDKKKEQHGEVPLNKEEEEFMTKLERKGTLSRMNTTTNKLSIKFTTSIKEQN